MTEEELLAVARLARIELVSSEVPQLARQLGSIIHFMEQLNQIDTTGIEPLVHPVPLRNVFRSDEIEESLPIALALANTHNHDGDFFSVPAVMDS